MFLSACASAATLKENGFSPAARSSAALASLVNFEDGDRFSGVVSESSPREARREASCGDATGNRAMYAKEEWNWPGEVARIDALRCDPELPSAWGERSSFEPAEEEYDAIRSPVGGDPNGERAAVVTCEIGMPRELVCAQATQPGASPPAECPPAAPTSSKVSTRVVVGAAMLVMPWFTAAERPNKLRPLAPAAAEGSRQDGRGGRFCGSNSGPKILLADLGTGACVRWHGSSGGGGGGSV